MPEEDVIAIATKDEDSDEMRAKLDAALELPFLSSGPHGVYIPNGQAKHKEAANWLRGRNIRSKRRSLDCLRSGQILDSHLAHLICYDERGNRMVNPIEATLVRAIAAAVGQPTLTLPRPDGGTGDFLDEGPCQPAEETPAFTPGRVSLCRWSLTNRWCSIVSQSRRTIFA
jgi:hypothetical protein